MLGETTVFYEIKGLIWRVKNSFSQVQYFGVSIRQVGLIVLTFFAAQHFWPWESRHSVMEYDNVGQTPDAHQGYPVSAQSFKILEKNPT